MPFGRWGVGMVCGAAAALAALAGCGGSRAVPTAVPVIAGSYSSAHFVFNYTTLDAGSIATIASGVESHYTRIVEDLGAGAMASVTVTLYLEHAAMVAATQPIAGFIPASASGLVTAENQIHLMSPNAPGWGPFDRMVSNLVHEFAHCVSLRVNPRVANNPRWLWESVAIYESRQWVDLGTVGYMAALAPPSLESLNSFDNSRVYEVGYSIGEFIVARWGQRALRDLVAANGDIVGVLGLVPADFHRDWFAFVRERYGSLIADYNARVLVAVLNLLFIGNSLTASNDLPGLIEAMGRASGIAIHCTAIARPNFSLEDHWSDGEARTAIRRGGWSHVILQQGPSALPESRVLLNEYARRFDRDVRGVKARTALFMVWPSAARRGDFDGVRASYAGAADLTGGLLLPSGDAWRAAWRREPGLALYGPDGFHPSPLGSYLAALAIFHGLTGHFPPASSAPPGISPRQFEILCAAVTESTGRGR